MKIFYGIGVLFNCIVAGIDYFQGNIQEATLFLILALFLHVMGGER